VREYRPFRTKIKGIKICSTLNTSPRPETGINSAQNNVFRSAGHRLTADHAAKV